MLRLTLEPLVSEVRHVSNTNRYHRPQHETEEEFTAFLLEDLESAIVFAVAYAVGFSAGPQQGLWAIFVYFFVQNIDGYLVVPYIARRTVDLAPAIVLAMQLLMGALFGILGVLFADPILASLKVVLVDLSHRPRRERDEAPEGN